MRERVVKKFHKHPIHSVKFCQYHMLMILLYASDDDSLLISYLLTMPSGRYMAKSVEMWDIDLWQTPHRRDQHFYSAFVTIHACIRAHMLNLNDRISLFSVFFPCLKFSIPSEIRFLTRFNKTCLCKV